MISLKKIQGLVNIKSQTHVITSLYLRLWPDSRIQRINVKNLIKEKREKLNEEGLLKEEKQFVEKDFEDLKKFVEALSESSHRGLVIFSSRALKIWEVFSLARPVRDLLILDYSAYIRPLISILNEYRRICTLLIDRTKARILEIFMGEIEEQSEIYDEVPGRVREGGWHGLSEKRIQRHIDDHLYRHLKEVADRTLIDFREKGFDWLLLGGHTEILSEVENTLHPFLREKLKRTFKADITIHQKEVLNKTIALEREIKREEDKVLVSRLANSLKPEGLGISGIHETLSSLYEGRVHTLLVEEGFIQEGAYCNKCGFMGLNVGVCPVCREVMIHVPDIVDEAVASAIDQGCEVFHIAPKCGLKEFGSVGAFLRYKAIASKDKAGQNMKEWRG
jgi:peptide subunit release factor 1 (eRF1)